MKTLISLAFLSAASLWEITIKQQIGKLKLDIPLRDLFDYADRNQVEILEINYAHLIILSKLPSLHNDPFDRLIVAQAIAEDLTLISRDKTLRKYKVKQQWK